MISNVTESKTFKFINIKSLILSYSALLTLKKLKIKIII
jgi:hypothetical protein